MPSDFVPIITDAAIPHLAYFVGNDRYEHALWLLRNGQVTQIAPTLNFHPEYIFAHWSPDGTRLAFVAADPKMRKDISDALTLRILSLDSLDIFSLPELPQSMAWSPDGTMIAYTVRSGDVPRVYIRDARNGTLLHHDLIYDAPFTGWLDTDHVLLYENKISVSANNEVLRPLVAFTLRNGSSRKLAENVSRVVVAPDRTRLAVTVSQKASTTSSILILDTGGQVLQTHDEGLIRAWSPDGSQIVYSNHRWDFFISPADVVQPISLLLPYQDALVALKMDAQENVVVYRVYGWSGDGNHLYIDLMMQNAATRKSRFSTAIYKMGIHGERWQEVVRLSAPTKEYITWVPHISRLYS